MKKILITLFVLSNISAFATGAERVFLKNNQIEKAAPFAGVTAYLSYGLFQIEHTPKSAFQGLRNNIRTTTAIIARSAAFGVVVAAYSTALGPFLRSFSFEK